MHYFYGNVKQGWWLLDPDGGNVNKMTVFEVPELNSNPQIVWIMTKDSGDFLWPHWKDPKTGDVHELQYRDNE